MDATAFREFEFEGWQKVANRYHDTFAGVTVQSIEPLLDAIEIRKGMHVLDLPVARDMARSRQRLEGPMFSALISVRKWLRTPGTVILEFDFQEGDAEALILSDQTFDAAIMNFGMLHLGCPERAIAEVFRVLRAGGRFAFTVWDTPDKSIGFGIVLSAIRKHGDMAVPIPSGPLFFRFSDRGESMRVLGEAGFHDMQTRYVSQTWRLPAADALFDTMMNASVRNAALLRAQQPEVLSSIREEIRAAVEQYRANGAFELPMPAVLFSARK